jgi:rhodanese-related sulfurtransferase
MITDISRDELKQKLDHPKKFVLLDVDFPQSYRLSHLPGALNLPLQLIHAQALEIMPNKDQETIVYSSGGEGDASEEAANSLSEMGYSRVRRYVGGKRDWSEAGLPLASDENKRAA